MHLTVRRLSVLVKMASPSFTNFFALVVQRFAALVVQRFAALVVQRLAAFGVQRFAALVV
jgi:hypothetical protein